MAKKTIEDIRKELDWLRNIETIHSVLIFGSYLHDEKPRDIDICLVTLGKNLDLETYGEITMRAPKYYDITVFEELPLYIKIYVIENNIVLLSRDKHELYEYFYRYRKIWRNQKYRNRMTKHDIIKTLENLAIKASGTTHVK